MSVSSKEDKLYSRLGILRTKRDKTSDPAEQSRLDAEIKEILEELEEMGA